MVKNWLTAMVFGLFAISLGGCGAFSDHSIEAETAIDVEVDLKKMENLGDDDAGTAGVVEEEKEDDPSKKIG